MSSEYFIAEISYIDMLRKYELISKEKSQSEYCRIEKELDDYSDIYKKSDKLIHVRQLLKDRKNKIL